MTDAFKKIPEGYHTVTPYLIVKGAAEAIEFYKKAFDAEEIARMFGSDGKSIAHAVIKVGNSIIQLNDEAPDNPDMAYFRAPQTLGAISVNFLVYVDDVEKIYTQAVAAGATALSPLMDQYWGDRIGVLMDPFGHLWTIATHTRDVSVEEIEKGVAQG
jgi:PhnB protein